MNKGKLITVLAAIAVLAALATGCKSQPAPAAYAQNEPRSASAQASAEARQTADKARVLDWANRGLGEEASHVVTGARGLCLPFSGYRFHRRAAGGRRGGPPRLDRAGP